MVDSATFTTQGGQGGCIKDGQSKTIIEHYFFSTSAFQMGVQQLKKKKMKSRAPSRTSANKATLSFGEPNVLVAPQRRRGHLSRPACNVRSRRLYVGHRRKQKTVGVNKPPAHETNIPSRHCFGRKVLYSWPLC